MKKIISLVLVLVCLLAFVACDGESIMPEKEKNYTLHFEMNGADPIEDMKTRRLESAPVVSREGYVFDGWYTDDTFATPAQFPMDLTNDITLYAKWYCVSYAQTLPDASLKLGLKYYPTMAEKISPAGFDLDLLKSKGYESVLIEVTYTVNYEKDWALFGYLGAPPYTAVILESDFDIDFDSDLEFDTDFRVEATKEPVTKTMTYEISFDALEDKKVMLIFSTANMQNIVHINGIEVKYTAKKPAGN